MVENNKFYLEFSEGKEILGLFFFFLGNQQQILSTEALTSMLIFCFVILDFDRCVNVEQLLAKT